LCESDSFEAVALGATSVEDLTSVLYRWVGDCHSTTSWGVVGYGRGWVLFVDLLMLIVLDVCDCCAVLSWSGDSIGWLFVRVEFCFVHVSRVIFAIVAMISFQSGSGSRWVLSGVGCVCCVVCFVVL
jgi:hypothetical protein